MRVTSDFFVGALVRKVFADNGFAAISRKGAAEAGAILIVVDRLDGCFDLYSPAPQAFFEEGDEGRLFEKTHSCAAREEIDARLASEARMDPDFWVVEIESADGTVDLPMAQDEPPKNPADDFFRI